MGYDIKLLLNNFIMAINNPDWCMVTVTAIGVIVSAILSRFLYNLTQKLGEQQNEIQYNNLRIQMHREYFDIYNALMQDYRQVDGLEHQFMNVLNKKMGYNLNDSKVLEILPRAKQLLPLDYYENISEFANCYTSIKRSTSDLYGYLTNFDSETIGILKEKLRSEKILEFLGKWYEIKDYDDIDKYKQSLKTIISLRENNFIEKIRSYSDLSDIIVKK